MGMNHRRDGVEFGSMGKRVVELTRPVWECHLQLPQLMRFLELSRVSVVMKTTETNDR
ncbi:hypothetical protein YC2023_115596 [Brassica napus]